MMSESAKLTAFERAAMESLLSGAHPILDRLREQMGVANVTSREMTGVGCYVSFDVVDKALSIEFIGGPARIVIGDGVVTIPGMQAGVGSALFVDHGVIQMLELFTYDEPWPEKTDGASFSYTNLPRKIEGLPSISTSSGGS